MASLKDMRVRIASTKATQKITKAMQMVAASKLRRAQAAAEAARPFAERMEKVLGNIASTVTDLGSAPKLLAGTGNDQVHLLVVCTGERGLCGAFNSSIVRLAREQINTLIARRQGGENLLRRPQGLRAASPQLRKAHHRTSSSCASCARSASTMPKRSPRRSSRCYEARRVRRRDPVLLALQVGDRADPDRVADHSAGVPGQGRDRRRRGHPTNTSRTKTTFSASSCRAISRCRCSARCSRTTPPFYGAQMTRDGQRHAQCRRHDQEADHHL